MMEGARCFGYLKSRFESQTTGPQTTNLPLPIGSMYCILNVGKYTIHESYGLVEPNALTNNDALTAQIGLTVPTDSRSTLLWSCHLKHEKFTKNAIYIYTGIQNVLQNKYLYQSLKYIKNRIRKLEPHPLCQKTSQNRWSWKHLHNLRPCSTWKIILSIGISGYAVCKKLGFDWHCPWTGEIILRRWVDKTCQSSYASCVGGKEFKSHNNNQLRFVK